VPLYDYSCTRCHRKFEAYQRMDEPVFTRCDRCGYNSLERLIGVPAIRTATTFASGRGTLLQQFGGDEEEVKRVVAEARKQGYNPSMYDIYEPCVAERKGDPDAFLPQSDPVGALKRACRKKGIGCDGRGVSIKSPPNNAPPGAIAGRRRKAKVLSTLSQGE